MKIGQGKGSTGGCCSEAWGKLTHPKKVEFEDILAKGINKTPIFLLLHKEVGTLTTVSEKLQSKN